MTKCPQCARRLVRRTTSHRIVRGGYQLSLDDIPAWVCERCAQPIFSDEQNETLRQVIDALDTAVERLRIVRRT